MSFQLPPGETTSGFVFGDLNRGVRWMVVRVIGENWSEKFEFIVEVPGFKADFHKLEDVEIYAEDDYTDLDEQGLVEWIEKQPAFVTNMDGNKTGDPLNLIIIGEADAVWPAFLSQGWGPTAAMTTGSALKTGVFGIFGGGYRYPPSAISTSMADRRTSRCRKFATTSTTATTSGCGRRRSNTRAYRCSSARSAATSAGE